MPSSMTRQPSLSAELTWSRNIVHAEEVSHICTTLFTDLTHLSELEIASALTQPGQLNQKTTLSDKSRTHTDPRHRLHAVNTSSDPMHALIRALLLRVALSVLSSAAQALEMGPCDPAKALKIVDTSLGERKMLQHAMEVMI